MLILILTLLLYKIMIYIIGISIILAYLVDKYLYKICKEIKKTKYITLFIYVSIILATVLIYYKYQSTSDFIRYISLLPFIIIISIIDYKTTYIYDITLVSGIIVQGTIFLITINSKEELINYIVALVIGLTVPFSLARITQGLGEGDIGLFGLCCFALGYNYSFYLIILSFILASIYCMYLIFIKKGKIRKIPFAPFISLATIMIMLTKYDLLNFYFYSINRLF